MASPDSYIRNQRGKPSVARTLSALMRILSKASPDDLADLETVETWQGDSFYGDNPPGPHAVGSARVLGIGPGSEASGAGAVEMAGRYGREVREGDANNRGTMQLNEMLNAVRNAGYDVTKSTPADTLIGTVNALIRKTRSTLRTAALEGDDSKRAELIASACKGLTDAKLLLKSAEEDEEDEAEDRPDDEEIEKATHAVARLEDRIRKSAGGMQSLDIKGYLNAVSGSGPVRMPPSFDMAKAEPVYEPPEDSLTLAESITRETMRQRVKMAQAGLVDMNNMVTRNNVKLAMDVLAGGTKPVI